MSTPSDPSSPGASDTGAPKPTPPKPAFKVTRSPLAPKITGAVPAMPAASLSSSAPSAPASARMAPSNKALSIGAAAALEGVEADRPGYRPPTPSRSASAPARREGTSVGGLLIDLIAATAACIVAVLMGLDYMSRHQ